jgi:hypothetical protein
MKNLRLVALVLVFALYGSVHAKSLASPTLWFEENRGQAPADARFLARGQGYNIVFTPDGNDLVLRQGGEVLTVRTRIVGATADRVLRGEEKLDGKVHYLRSTGSLTDIPTYGRVRHERVYPGIDLIYYGSRQHQLEYDFIVDPGADPHQIALRFDGVETVGLDDSGNLVLRTAGSEIVQQKPVVYQTRRNLKEAVDGQYRLLSANTVGFAIGPYDRGATLVIDPILSYSTFLGGSSGDDDARAVATDSAGNVYVTGSTTSTNFQTVAAMQPTAGTLDPLSGMSDVFVSKFNPSGTALIFSTYLGGTNDDDANSIAVDVNGNVLVGGSTTSTDFPTTQGTFRRTCTTSPEGCADAFAAEINPSGSLFIYSTYLGGTGVDEVRGVAFDAVGSSYVTGRTTSEDFPLTPLAYSTDPAAGGFVMKLTAGGTILYSTYFRTIFGPADPQGIAVDTLGNAYVTGGIVNIGSATGVDVFLTKLNPTGTGFLYTQTIRAGKDDLAKAVVLDAAGNAYVVGETNSINFPATPGVPQVSFGGGPAFRSSDAGVTWSASRSGFTRTSLYALAVAPGTPATLYAGADDEVGGGVFKSTNEGDSWTLSSTGITDPRIHALAVDPAAPATVYAGSRGQGVFKSTNAGVTWAGTPLNNVFVTALTVDPGAPGTLYAGTEANGIYKSTNSGASWFLANGGLAMASVRGIVLDPASNTTVYAATSAGVYKSVNGGGTWTAASSGLLDSNVNAIVADPRTPNVVYAGTNSVGIFRSSNGGGLWLPSNFGIATSPAGTSVSALTIDQSSGTLYAAVGHGNALQLYKSSNGTTWIATSLATTRVTALAVDRNNSNAVYAATVGGSDGFIAKWSASGSLAYATFVGGYRDDSANGVAADAAGGVYVAGTTSSTNFPSVNALQTAFRGGSGVVTDAFALKVEPSGAQFGFSTYLGGTSDDFGKGIAVDSSNTAYIVGATNSSDFPTANALNPTPLGLLDAFVVKLGEGSVVAYSVPLRGGFSATSPGTASALSVGYGRIQQTPGGSVASGLAIFGFRQNNILVSEAAVPASTLIRTGRIYAEIGNNVDTGIAIANPNGATALIEYYFTDAAGQTVGANSTSIAPNGQISAFLNQAPFSGSSSMRGTFTFTSSQPVAVIALRGFTNQRGEFLITTLPVADLTVVPDTEPILFPHFADGGGWITQILLSNTTDAPMSGTVQFGGLVPQNYSIAPRSSARIATPGTAESVFVGAARVLPAAGTLSPVGVAVFAFTNNGVTVTEAGVPSMRSATAFRLYAESSGAINQPGSIQTGIALANPSSNSIQVRLELTTITGITTGLSATILLPGNGQAAMFLAEIPGFAGLPNPFQGVLRVSTTAPTGVSIVGLRGRYNERRDFLITTTQPTNETIVVTGGTQYFPHFADGGGYTTQFILFNGAGDQPSSGLIQFFNQSGQTLSLGVR